MEDIDELSVIDFNDMKSFFVSLVFCMIIGDIVIKIGVVIYVDGVIIVFLLNQYFIVNGVIMGIININQGSNVYNRSSCYVDRVLKYIQMEFFIIGNGDCFNVVNYYIFLIGGLFVGNKVVVFGLVIRFIVFSNIFIVGKMFIF